MEKNKFASEMWTYDSKNQISDSNNARRCASNMTSASRLEEKVAIPIIQNKNINGRIMFSQTSLFNTEI